jgi:hypothetical protein
MTTGFELGKLYKNTGAGAPFNQWVHKCVYVNEAVALMEFTGRKSEISVWPHHKFESNGWKEVIEPRREFFNAYRREINGKGTYYVGPFYTRALADENEAVVPNREFPRYGVLELIHHSETKVESVFHMVRK